MRIKLLRYSERVWKPLDYHELDIIGEREDDVSLSMDSEDSSDSGGEGEGEGSIEGFYGCED